MNTQLANIEPLLLVEIQAGFLKASGHIFINWSIHDFALCVSLFKDTLFSIKRDKLWYVLLIHCHWTHSQQHCNSCLNELIIILTFFSVRYTTASFCSGTLDSMLGGYFKQLMHQQKAENRILKRLREGDLFIVQELQWEGRALGFWVLLGKLFWGLQFFSFSVKLFLVSRT